MSRGRLASEDILRCRACSFPIHPIGEQSSKSVVDGELVGESGHQRQSTARIIAPVLGIAESEIVQNEAIYNAELQALLYAVGEIPGKCQHALMFGHMPGVAELVHFLSGSAPDHFPTCGVAMLELNVPHWSDANRSCGKLNAFLYPKMLDAQCREGQ